MTSPAIPLAAEEPPAWHALAPEQALARLSASPEGLGEEEAARRLARRGPNALLLAPPVSAWRLLLDQFRSVIVGLLAAAALVSLSLGDHLDAAAIGVVLLINTAIGFLSEWRARRTMEALRSLEVQRATVLRDGQPRELDARGLVPGDVVLLEPGEAVPADLRLLVASEVRANEAPLTGESLPVEKGVPAVAEDALLPERASLLYKGTLVVAGSARAVVVATGLDTEVGRISELVAATEDESTPLERRLQQLGRRLVGLTLGVVALVTAVGLLRGGDPWLMLQTGIALAVAAVPEGLPVVAVITLAVGMSRMAARRALVRRLTAVEALGSVTVLCTDKTGTLTAGEMSARCLRLAGGDVAFSGRGYVPRGALLRDGAPVSPDDLGDGPLRRALEICALVNRARLVAPGDGQRAAGGAAGPLPPEAGEEGWTVDGDPTEGALLVAAARAGLSREALQQAMPEVAEAPFSSERMAMATLHRLPDGSGRVLLKGAPGVVLDAASAVLEEGGVVPLDETRRARWRQANDALATEGYRVLALACRDEPGGPRPEALAGDGGLRELVLVGLVGLIDPAAEGVADTIAGLRRAGVRTIMLTGDQRLTAEAVARRLGVLSDDEETLDGRELAALPTARLGERLARVGAFSRVSPEQKLRIVRGLQQRGEVVGMLGDGVNDAAALKGADIGVAMGRRGTDVAKETADVVLADDRLETVVAAVEGGRVIDDNIRKFVFYLFSSNLSEVLVLLVAGLVGWPLPLLPLQILWINLVSDVFPALALAMEPAEPDVMERPPIDPGRALLSRGFLLSVLLHGAALTAVGLLPFALALGEGEAGAARARTLCFFGLALAQVLHAVNARSGRAVLFSRRALANRWLAGAVLLSAALMLAALQLPALARVLGTTPLPAATLAMLCGLALLPLLAGQLWRLVRADR